MYIAKQSLHQPIYTILSICLDTVIDQNRNIGQSYNLRVSQRDDAMVAFFRLRLLLQDAPSTICIILSPFPCHDILRY